MRSSGGGAAVARRSQRAAAASACAMHAPAGATTRTLQLLDGGGGRQRDQQRRFQRGAHKDARPLLRDGSGRGCAAHIQTARWWGRHRAAAQGARGVLNAALAPGGGALAAPALQPGLGGGGVAPGCGERGNTGARAASASERPSPCAPHALAPPPRALPIPSTPTLCQHAPGSAAAPAAVGHGRGAGSMGGGPAKVAATGGVRAAPARPAPQLAAHRPGQHVCAGVQVGARLQVRGGGGDDRRAWRDACAAASSPAQPAG